MNKRGQSYEVFKLLQGALIALVFLGIVYGIITMAQSYFTGSDPFSVSATLLSSAYAAPGQQFNGEAILKQQDFADVLP